MKAGKSPLANPCFWESRFTMVKGRCAQCQIFVVHEEIDRLILSGWKSLEDTHPVVRDIIPMLCPDCRRTAKLNKK